MTSRFSSPAAFGRQHSIDARRERSVRPLSCVALIDDRFIAWLMQRECDPGQEPAVNRKPLARVLGRIVGDGAMPVSLKRIYWYTDRPDNLLVDDQVVRAVSGSDEAPAWHAIERDLSRIAQSRSYESVLIVCDDERILRAVDEAQLSGLSVLMLSDDALLDFAELKAEEPQWANLLAQADRRVVVRPEDLLELHSAEGLGTPNGRSVEETSESPSTIEEVVRGWWDSQTEQSRQDLRSALSVSSGIPQEIDRELLLQSRERFVRPLSLSEKRQMRDCLRGIAASGVLRDSYAQADSGSPAL